MYIFLIKKYLNLNYFKININIIYYNFFFIIKNVDVNRKKMDVF